MTMRIGQVEVTGSVGRRDAFHVAAILMRYETGNDLRPGDSVRFTDKNFTAVRRSGVEDRHGIVDPFLKDLKCGEAFWVLIKPELVSGLGHYFDITASDLVPSPAAVNPPAPSIPVEKEDSEEEDAELFGLDAWSRQDVLRCRAEGCS